MKTSYKILITGTMSFLLFTLTGLLSFASDPSDSLKNDNYYTVTLSNDLEITGKIVGQDSNHVIIKNNDGTYKILKQDILNLSICEEYKTTLLEKYNLNKEPEQPAFSLNFSIGLALLFKTPGYELGGGISFYPTNNFSPRFNFSYRRFSESSDYSDITHYYNYYCFNVDLLIGKVNPKNSFIYYGIIKIENDIVKESQSSSYNNNYYGYDNGYDNDNRSFYLGLIGLGGGLGTKLSKRTSLFFECSVPIYGFTEYGSGFIIGYNVFSLKAGINYSF